MTRTKLVADSSNDEWYSGKATETEQTLRFVGDYPAVHVRPKLRVDRMIERKLHRKVSEIIIIIIIIIKRVSE